MTVIGIAIGGGLGALARYHIGGVVAPRNRTLFPMATLIVNVVGSLLLGLIAGMVLAGRLPGNWLTWAGTGFCGGLTTFSTFTYETLQLADEGAWKHVWANILVSLPLSVAAATAGYLFGSAL